MKTKTDIWNGFSPERYVTKNYATLSVQDTVIIERLLKRHYGKKGTIMEVGGAVNLYPVFTMLPFYSHIMITDVSTRNLYYLASQMKQIDPVWVQYIDLIRVICPVLMDYDFQEALRSKVRYQQLSVYDLRPDMTDHISMNFLAESITDDLYEFYAACEAIKQAVPTGGEITAVFMEGSEGYTVGGHRFPAVPVKIEHIIHAFADTESALAIHIPILGKPIRSGYTGMIYYQGRKAEPTKKQMLN